MPDAPDAAYPFLKISNFSNKAYYLAGPETEGPGIVVTAQQTEEGTIFRALSPDKRVFYYKRPPTPDEDMNEWGKKSYAKIRDIQSSLGWEVVIQPPLSAEHPEHFQRTAAIVGRQALVRWRDSAAPNTITSDLAAANVPHDQIHVKIIRRDLDSIIRSGFYGD